MLDQFQPQAINSLMHEVFRSDSMSKRERDECFGLPNSGAIAGIVFGMLIVLWGSSSLLGWEINFMAFAVIIFGTLIVAGAIYKLTRRGS